ncbi:Hypothetical predicted protein [Cloeon dipterum]|uniref:Uncharacterized protein n=1 Tax=Cloeon dipterum TaxID=197152 RepID=A0A8S1DCN2_9INSE|nr:Hypothetical predicted protein [Cloeon dipterum]
MSCPCFLSRPTRNKNYCLPQLLSVIWNRKAQHLAECFNLTILRCHRLFVSNNQRNRSKFFVCGANVETVLETRETIDVQGIHKVA